MDAFKCDECRAIYQDLREAYRAATQDTRDRHETSQQIANWVQELSEEECARIRETSSVWKTWRRWQEHRSLTGHALSVLPIPPNALSNPN
jgi:uncharacterized protein YhaN